MRLFDNCNWDILTDATFETGATGKGAKSLTVLIYTVGGTNYHPEVPR